MKRFQDEGGAPGPPLDGSVVPPRADREPSTGSHRPQAVVIEDDADIAHLLDIHLEAMGFDVRSFATGEAGLAAVEDRLPAVVLLDLNLPDVNGWDVLRRLRDGSGTSDVPVVLTSVSDLSQRWAHSASGVLQKPFMRADVQQATARYLTA